MASIRAHEFISLDGVFESPTWTMEFGFDPGMGETIAALTSESDTILLGRPGDPSSTGRRRAEARGRRRP